MMKFFTATIQLALNDCNHNQLSANKKKESFNLFLW